LVTNIGQSRLLRIALVAIVAVAGLRTTSVRAERFVDMRVFGPFVCRADFPLHAHEPIFGELAQIQQDLIHRLGIAPAQERIEVCLFRSRSSYDSYLKQWFPGVPYRRALYTKNKGPGVVLAYNSDQLHVDVRHECTHALLHASLPMVPLWLDEGLAEYYEVSPADRIYGNPHRKGLVWNLRFGQVPSLTRLEAKRELKEMGRSEYREAWAWVHFMLHGPPEARDELTRYLADIRDGTPPGQLSTRLKRRMSDPRGQLVRHFKILHR
jgi:hypothetical protein